MAPPDQSSSDDRSASPPLRRRWTILAAVIFALLAVLLAGRQAAIWRAQAAAAKHIDEGAVGAAEPWLRQCDWLAPADFRTDLLRAACFRQLGQQQPWSDALTTAEGNGAQGVAIELERRLGQIRFGQADQISSGDYQSLVRAGASPPQAAEAVVQGLIGRQDLESAIRLIDAQTPDAVGEAQLAHLRGLYFWSNDQHSAAQAEFENCLQLQASHEMARASLARMCEQQEQLSKALAHYSFLAALAPEREAVRIGLARVLRKLARQQDSRSVLMPPVAETDVSREMAVELAEREFEAGNYGEARRWHQLADLEGAHIAETLRAAASVFALNGDAADARRLFARVDDAQNLSRQVGELQRRLQIDPRDHVAADQLQLIARRQSGDAPAQSEAPTDVDPLYVDLCAACHGASGDGKGRAARHLHPRPRSLRSDRFRLVSTVNAVPARQDIERVIKQGIAGVSMPAFGELTDEQLARLTDQVLRFRAAGIRDRLMNEIAADAEPVDEREIDRLVETLTTPGDILQPPAMDSVTPRSIAHGRELYVRLGCAQCHGSDGSGAIDTPLFDDEGRPASPRDLTRDPLKAGRDPAALFLRIRLGMPGTPHPGVAGALDEELVALVYFCLSLRVENAPPWTNHQRALRAVAH